MLSKILRYYQIGDLRIQYTGPDIQEMDYLKVFRNPVPPETQSGTITESPETEPEAPAVMKIPCDIRLDVEPTGSTEDYNTRFLMRELNLPARVLDYQAVFLHASYIIWHEKAILFTAPKQTGKSTQAGIWERYKGAEIINGDRALIRRAPQKVDSSRDRETEPAPEHQNTWTVYGSPYCGTSGICKNQSAPLAAIVILGQAPENRIRTANIGERVQAMLDGCSYDTADRGQVQKVMDLTMRMVQEVPFIILDCLPDHTAADTLEDYLCRKMIM